MATLVNNKRIGRSYEIKESLVSGIVLTGNEVKSLKNGRGSLEGSYVRLEQTNAWLVGAYVPGYQIATDNDSASRPRKLLLTKPQLKELAGQTGQGLQIIPKKIFSLRGLVKVELGIGRGLKKADKRQQIKKRDAMKAIRLKLSRGA